MMCSPGLTFRPRSEIEARGPERVFAEIVPPLIRNAATCRNLAVRMRSIGNHLEARRYDNEANMFEARAVVAGMT
jgi:hypothetical protein